MTLEDLLDELKQLHPASMTARVISRSVEYEKDILSVSYEGGCVILQVEDEDEPTHDDASD